jgi:hypothetical protein
MGEVETAEELLLFLGSLNGIESNVKSDHVLNLFSEVEGRLPKDKAEMISTAQSGAADDLFHRQTHAPNLEIDRSRRPRQGSIY